MWKKELDRKKRLAENWYWYLTGENKDGFSSQYEFQVKWIRRSSGLFPGTPRCFECNMPLSGLASWLTRTHPSSFSPRLCSKCEQTMRKEEAGAEAELSMLFADVRGSTTLAETSTTTEFRHFDLKGLSHPVDVRVLRLIDNQIGNSRT